MLLFQILTLWESVGKALLFEGAYVIQKLREMTDV